MEDFHLIIVSYKKQKPPNNCPFFNEQRRYVYDIPPDCITLLFKLLSNGTAIIPRYRHTARPNTYKRRKNIGAALSHINFYCPNSSATHNMAD